MRSNHPNAQQSPQRAAITPTRSNHPNAQQSPQRAAITPTRSNHPNAQQSTVAGDQLRIENVAGKVSSSPPLVKSMPCKVHDDPTSTVVGTVKFK